MFISNTAFRRAEAMLNAANIGSADALMSVIALALETMAPPQHPGEAGIPNPISIRVTRLAERLGWNSETIVSSLLHASEEIRANLGFRLFSHDLAEGEETGAYTSTTTPIRVRLSGQLTSILCGTALHPVGREDPQALALDGPAMAALDLVACCVESGGGAFLLRETETAGDRVAELHAITATIANHPHVYGNVVITGPASTVQNRDSPAAAILSAVLHGAGAIVLTDPLFDQPSGGLGDEADTFDENDQPRGGARNPLATFQSRREGAEAPAPRSDRRDRASRPEHRAGAVRRGGLRHRLGPAASRSRRCCREHSCPGGRSAQRGGGRTPCRSMGCQERTCSDQPRSGRSNDRWSGYHLDAAADEKSGLHPSQQRREGRCNSVLHDRRSYGHRPSATCMGADQASGKGAANLLPPRALRLRAPRELLVLATAAGDPGRAHPALGRTRDRQDRRRRACRDRGARHGVPRPPHVGGSSPPPRRARACHRCLVPGDTGTGRRADHRRGRLHRAGPRQRKH